MTRPPLPQHPASQPLLALRGLLFVLTALTLLGAQAASTLHHVFVPHHLCAEHGVLEDGGPEARAVEPHSTEATAAIQAVDADEDLHEACPVATRSEHAVLLRVPALTVEPWPTPSLGLSVGSSRPLAQNVVLDQAPKTSPPRV